MYEAQEVQLSVRSRVRDVIMTANSSRRSAIPTLGWTCSLQLPQLWVQCPMAGQAGAEGSPWQGTPARNAVSGKPRKAPDQLATAGATPGRKRKALKEPDPPFSPEKKQRPGSAAGISSPGKATPSQRKPGRPKTPSKAGSRPATPASPMRSGAKKAHGASGVSTQPYNTSPAKPLQRPLGSPGRGRERTISSIYRTPSTAGKRLVAASSRGTPQLRDRASIAEKGAKPWWVV